ncbi:MAG TPA: hypothetical protein ENJ18_19120 [Nannocystis exedens]|nr:hypothetical protein [Nannocystis exedens]
MIQPKDSITESRQDPDAELGILLWLSLVVAGLILGLIFWIASNWLAPVRTECSDAVADDCGEGEICENGVCLEAEPSCALNGPCAGCRCSSPRSCEQDLCVMPPVTTEVSVCNDAEAMSVLTDLIKQQEKCEQKMARCPVQRLGEYMTNKENFDEVLTRFGEVFVVVFPDSKPDYGIDGTISGDWPNRKTRQHYLELFRARKESLWNAGHIIALGRASQTRNAANDVVWAQKRVLYVDDMMIDLAEESPSEGASPAQMLEFAVGSDAALSLETLVELPQIRVIAPSRELEEGIYSARDSLAEGRIPRRMAYYNSWLNRSVVVVIVPPCPSKGSR